MSDDRPLDREGDFTSLLSLLQKDVTATQLAIAVELAGVSGWDRLGRYLNVPPIDWTPAQGALRDEVFSELVDAHSAKGTGEPFSDETPYFIELFNDPLWDWNNVLFRSGWRSVALPDFEALEMQWNERESGVAGVPRKPMTMTYDSPKRADNWALCIRDAFLAYRQKHGADPNEGQLWTHIFSGESQAWGVSASSREAEMTLAETTIDRTAFRKRYRRYFKRKADRPQ